MKKKILAYALGPIMVSIIGLATTPLLTWVIDPEDMGRIAIFHLVSSITTLIITLGLDQYFMRNYYKDKGIIFMCYPLGLVFLTLLSCFIITFSTLLEESIFDYVSNYSLVTFFLLFNYYLSLTNRYASIVLRMEDKALDFSFSQIIAKLTILLPLCLAFVLSYRVDFQLMVVLYTVSALFVTCYSIHKSNFIHFFLNAKITGCLEHSKDGLKFGLPLVVSGLAYWLLTGADKVMLKSYASLSELAVYSVAVSFSSFAVIIKSVFGTIWMPSIYRSETNDSKDETKELLLDVIPKITALVIIVFCIVGVFSPLIDFFLPEHYSGVASIIVCCCGYPLFYTLSESSSAGLYIKKKTHLVSFVTIIALVINLCVNYLTIPIYGAKGAAISTLISFFVYYIIRSELSSRIWIRTKNIKGITFSILAIILSIQGVLYYEPMVFSFLWLILLLAVLLSYKTEVREIFQIVKGKN